jgi:hypothetical protein
MRILIDPVTTNDPEYCSAHYKMQLLTRHLVDAIPNCFVYYVLPEPQPWEVNHEWLFQHPNVKYLTIKQTRDRMKEYHRFSEAREHLYAYNGFIWDWDVVVTGRSLIPSVARAWMTRNNAHASRMVIIEDEFPIMSFKKRVALPSPDSQDFDALSNYLAADKTYMFSMASRGMLLTEARKWLAPSVVRQLEKKIVSATPIQFATPTPKSMDYVESVATGKKQFTCALTQRLSGKIDRRDAVLEAFEKEWIRYGTTQSRIIVTTNSPTVVEAYKDKKPFAEFMRCNRELFWKIMKEEADVCFSCSTDEDYPLSLLEPLAMGVPAVLWKAEYVPATYGESYPFIVSTDIQMFGMIQAFKDDYKGMYARFLDWFNGWFVPTMSQRNDLWFVPQVVADVKVHDQRLATALQDKADQSVVSLLDKWGREHGNEIRFGDALVDLEKQGKVAHLGDLYHRNREMISYAMGTSWNTYRQGLIHSCGWVDASQETGHLRLP